VGSAQRNPLGAPSFSRFVRKGWESTEFNPPS
jgi:hypothetical protein